MLFDVPAGVLGLDQAISMQQLLDWNVVVELSGAQSASLEQRFCLPRLAGMPIAHHAIVYTQCAQGFEYAFQATRRPRSATSEETTHGAQQETLHEPLNSFGLANAELIEGGPVAIAHNPLRLGVGLSPG
jgi:hypothetical protein